MIFVFVSRSTCYRFDIFAINLIRLPVKLSYKKPGIASSFSSNLDYYNVIRLTELYFSRNIVFTRF